MRLDPLRLLSGTLGAQGKAGTPPPISHFPWGSSKTPRVLRFNPAEEYTQDESWTTKHLFYFDVQKRLQNDINIRTSFS